MKLVFKLINLSVDIQYYLKNSQTLMKTAGVYELSRQLS